MRKACGGLVLTALLLGCSARPEPPRREALDTAAVRHRATRIAAEVLSPESPGCDTSSAVKPDRLVAITAEQTLSCLDLGYALRRIARQAERENGALLIAAPVSESETICRVLRREKVRAPVVFLADTVVHFPGVPTDILYVELGTTGEPLTVASERTGLALLERLDPTGEVN